MYLGCPIQLGSGELGTERKSQAGRKWGQTQPMQAGGREPGRTTCSSSRAWGSQGTCLAWKLPAGARTEKAGFLHAGFMCPLGSRTVARPRERQSLPPGVMFPREESRKQRSPGHMDGPRTSLRDHGLLALFPGTGAEGPTQQDLAGPGWLQPCSATAAWPEPDRHLFPPPVTVTPGCHLELGWLLTAHCAPYTWPLKVRPLLQCAPAPAPIRHPCPRPPGVITRSCWLGLRDKLKLPPSSHFQGHLSSPGCPRLLGGAPQPASYPCPTPICPFSTRIRH